MYKKVVVHAFEKAKNEIAGSSNKTSQSNYIAEALINKYKFQISGKTLRTLFDKSKNKVAEEDIEIKSKYVEYLCQFLGYDSYQEFLEEHGEVFQNHKRKGFIGFVVNNKVTLSISFITIIVVLTITTIDKQRWMIWQEDQYVQVDFDPDEYALSKLKLFNENRIKNFRKVKPDCSTVYFTENGDVNLWYGKNADGNYEYFTSLGKHPETGKALKAISDYMIKKHLCAE